ncbi:hypothetical protein SEA_BOBBY_54 [Mycobacterium phage Bobby]|nr:hypothetical protein SEA_BOBBY_54 [Mycobacterium phage Bobby]
MMTISMTKHATAQEFHCDRCDKDKKSKSIGEWRRGDTTVTICNGCYGWLNANGESQA